MKLFKLLKEQWKYMKDDKGKIIYAIILTLLASLIGITYGYLIGAATEAITEKDLRSATMYLLIYIGTSIICHLILHRGSSKAFNKIRINLTKKMGLALYNKTLMLPSRAFEEKKSGEIINRIINDTSTVTDLLKQLISMAIRILSCIIIYIYIVIESWLVAFEILIFILITYVISKIFLPKMKEENKKIQEEKDNCILDVNQGVLGIREIKSLGNRNIIFSNFKKLVAKTFKDQNTLADYEVNYNQTIYTLNSIFEALVFLTCGFLIFYDKASITFFIAMTYYVYRFIYITELFSQISTSYQKVVVSMERISEILDNKLYNDEKFGDVDTKEIKGNITFKDVDFGYEKDNLMLRDFNLELETNKKIAIVGKSGGGKTTLFNLLLRLFDPIQGDIFIDDINIRDFNEETLRSHISIIRQDPFLFNKTILENFKIVNPDITLDEVRDFCKKACIDEYIVSLEKQYDTLIGEGGVNLSGGQKQRLAIARTLMKNSKIILFDEATSALDNESQEYIKHTIDELAKNHTVIIIAHRLSTIKDADKIYLIDNGQVIASGKHDYLLKNNKIYKKLYNPEQIELNI
ncbi:MAG: ABC transporter ATP-binding protein [Bacilli bacterium]|nr:ABC transporter ATP-binding protein [Bacilli bacterium]